MLLPCVRIRLSCLTATSCCASTAPTPSNKAPTTTTVRFISQYSVLRGVSKRSRASAARAAAYSTVELPAPPFIPGRGRISEAVLALMLADRNPDPLRSRRHIDVIDLVFAPQPLDDGIDHRRAGPDRAGLARALDTKRIGLAGHVVGLEHERRAVGRARQRVIHEGAGDQLTILRAVDCLLHQGLADPLHGTAMHLAGEQQRIQRHAEIIDDDVV